MERHYTEGANFKDVDFAEKPMQKGEFENCSFLHCNLSHADLSNIRFVACSFEQCDFSMAKLHSSSLREILFVSCKMFGLHFEHCDPFLLSMNFTDCQLNLSSFFKQNLKQSKFKQCNLQEVDFSEANLSGLVFEACDFLSALFNHTNLEGADFRTAFNYVLQPDANQIKRARFSLPAVVGLLQHYNIDIEL